MCVLGYMGICNHGEVGEKGGGARIRKGKGKGGHGNVIRNSFLGKFQSKQKKGVQIQNAL